MATYGFFVYNKEGYVDVEQKLQELDPDFAFEDGKEYLITLDKPAKVCEKIGRPELGEGILVDYFYGLHPKLFTYIKADEAFWLASIPSLNYVIVEDVVTD
jgi:hypothetical protein